ncbi:hypothetical protein KSZ_71760 [Dictyobacter formicarum]|uniref:Protein kinase domain-containing protein n=2 Tax=Dictyobacter formicarum TaxID=2778368 RepID=A0ABQ3VSJ0_9CHLR|nr:hypothetical protein KSZ_71760 [Dictyobacter formicarum]
MSRESGYFLVMGLIDGTNLRHYLRARRVLAVDRVVVIAHDVALGLGAAHRHNIVHRGVKSQDIMLGRDGSIKVVDFSLASDLSRDRRAEDMTPTDMALSMYMYSAPGMKSSVQQPMCMGWVS